MQSLPLPGDEAIGLLPSQSESFSIWVNGEEHWISGADSSTTCADLICALISYQIDQKHVLSKEEILAPQQFAIVQKQRHYEEYLDSSARLLDVITSPHAMPKEEVNNFTRKTILNISNYLIPHSTSYIFVTWPLQVESKSRRPIRTVEWAVQ